MNGSTDFLKKPGQQLYVPHPFTKQQTVSPFLCTTQHILNNQVIARFALRDLIVVLSDGG